jgi:AraC-like DNA-binding protein/quercetin dioxygenase-like cupin family protein
MLQTPSTLQASYEVLQQPSGHSFLMKIFGERAFTAPYHFHPEFELTLILEGRGRRFTGNHMADFSPGDLVLVGSHLPHCWKLEPGNTGNTAGAIVIQFAPDFLGAGFFSRAEMEPVGKLLQRSSCGIEFRNETRETVNRRIGEMAGEKSNFRRLMQFLEILHGLALSGDGLLLDSQRVSTELAPLDQERTQPVFAYLVENFRGEISLNRAAAISGMTPSAFCRYFKKITRKTFMETVIEYRLNYARQQLVQTDRPISSICFDSGFGDISHFHKTFRSKMKSSPLHYRRKFMQEMNASSG